MKKALLFTMIVLIGVALMAQSRKYSNPGRQAVPAAVIENTIMPEQTVSPIPHNKAILEDIIGDTRYDLQTNSGIEDRLIVWPDGTISAAFTKGEGETSYTNRGSAYNYFDGTAWGDPPAARIETVRTGWPTMQKLNGNGEIVVSHRSGTTTMVMERRAEKGTGAWTESFIPNPVGASGMLWPRIMTNGPTNNVVHMVALTAPTGNGGTVYQGLDGALLYFRSLDGGDTWDIPGVILPGLDATNYDGFSADTYHWGTPHGDTIYFGVSGHWQDTFIMQSNDNGLTWTKIPILSNANKKLPAGVTEVPDFYSGDGAIAVEMDKSGIIHAAFGKGGGYASGGSKYIFINVNGLIYWNTTMPMVQDSLDLDSLEAHGNLLGYVVDGPGPNDTITAAPSYRIGLSSHAQISVDEYNNIYVLYNAVKPGNPYNDLNFRHMWIRAKFHDRDNWTEMKDLNEGVLYLFYEFAFSNMAKNVRNNMLHIIYQSSLQPGSALIDATIPVHDNTIEHREVSVSSLWPTGVQENKAAEKNYVSQNYPNPVKSLTSFNVKLEKPANVTIEVSNLMGQKLVTLDKGYVNSGAQKYTIDCSQFTSGVYFYTVKIDGETFTHKMIVE